ncbi:MAG: class I SAM-dependent methyltransferase [Parachlamydiales bacterium]|nr:class I SAM-dependent methyltransferase [Parachlamydiales bacterium]
MDELATQELLKYERIWTTFPEYREEGPADYLTPVFLHYFPIQKGESIIDFGCGSGRSALPLLKAGLKVHLVDICDSCLDPEIFLLQMQGAIEFTKGCLWSLPKDLNPADWGICFDVLEHLPEEKIDVVLQTLSSRIKKGGLFSIFLKEDQFGQAVGEKLHLTVQPAEWWKEKIGRHFLIEETLLSDDSKIVLVVYREGLKNRVMPRRRPDFGSGVAGAEAAKLKKFSDGGGSQNPRLSDAGRTDSSITSGIKKVC